MKARIVILMLIFVLMLSGSVVMAQSSEPGSSKQYTLQPGLIIDKGYQLTSLTWQVSGAAGDERYRLLSPNSPTGTGTPCCCSHLPCVMRSP